MRFIKGFRRPRDQPSGWPPANGSNVPMFPPVPSPVAAKPPLVPTASNAQRPGDIGPIEYGAHASGHNAGCPVKKALSHLACQGPCRREMLANSSGCPSACRFPAAIGLHPSTVQDMLIRSPWRSNGKPLTWRRKHMWLQAKSRAVTEQLFGQSPSSRKRMRSLRVEKISELQDPVGNREHLRAPVGAEERACRSLDDFSPLGRSGSIKRSILSL